MEGKLETHNHNYISKHHESRDFRYSFMKHDLRRSLTWNVKRHYLRRKDLIGSGRMATPRHQATEESFQVQWNVPETLELRNLGQEDHESKLSCPS